MSLEVIKSYEVNDKVLCLVIKNTDTNNYEVQKGLTDRKWIFDSEDKALMSAYQYSEIYKNLV